MMFFWQIGFALIVAEIFVFAAVIAKIGAAKTFVLWIFSAVLGGWLVKQQGMATLNRAQAAFARGAVPVDDMFEGLCLLGAGAMFILPGFLSDAVAFALLFPMVRKTLRDKTPHTVKAEPNVRTQEEGIIEGDYVRVEERVEKIERK
jgi:UPF0716 protein FxsA